MDAVRQGHTKAFIRTVDSDLVCIAIALFLEIENLTHLWIGYGKGKDYKDVAVHHEARKLGKDKSLALLVFVCLGGVDTVSQPLGIGKKTSWDTWKIMPEMTAVFLKLLEDPYSIDSDPSIFASLQHFMIKCYSKVCSAPTLDLARLKLFETGSKVLEALPPTTASYYQHCRRAILQGAYFWKQSAIAMMDVPEYSSWGWVWDGTKWVPLWKTKKVASSACEALVRCGCKVACRGNCKCCKRGKLCSTLCACKGACTNNGEDS